MKKQQKEIIKLLRKFSKVLNLKKTEIKIYEFLINKKKPLLVREIHKQLKLSRRIVQEYVKKLTKKGLLKRVLIKKNNITYKYLPKSPIKIWNKIKENINDIFKKKEKIFEKSSF